MRIFGWFIHGVRARVCALQDRARERAEAHERAYRAEPDIAYYAQTELSRANGASMALEAGTQFHHQLNDSPEMQRLYHQVFWAMEDRANRLGLECLGMTDAGLVTMKRLW